MDDAPLLARNVKTYDNQMSQRVKGCICSLAKPAEYIKCINAFINAHFQLVSTLREMCNKTHVAKSHPQFATAILQTYRQRLVIPINVGNSCDKQRNRNFPCPAYLLHSLRTMCKADIATMPSILLKSLREQHILKLLDHFPPYLLPHQRDFTLTSDYDLFSLICT